MAEGKGVTRSRENTRARLMEAAIAVFAEVGLDAASVEVICERAGFTRGAFYSNFASKNELFVALAGEVTGERVRLVRQRVAALEARGAFDASRGALEILEEVLDFDAADRTAVLLMSEIRIHALRDPELADAYLAQDDELRQQVMQIIEDIARARALRLRLPADRAARVMLTAWEGAAIRAVMRGLPDQDRVRAVGAEVARIAEILIEPESPSTTPE